MTMTQKKIKLLTLLGILLFLLIITVFFLSGHNYMILKSVFIDDLSGEEVHDRLAEFGIMGYATVAILAMLQVFLCVLPAEPVQVAAGAAFGFLPAVICCTIGVVLGNTIIFLLYKVYGERLKEYFERKLTFDLNRTAASYRATLIIFILYFLPAIPYGMICFFAATLGIKYPRYITVTVLGSIPSVCIGVALGHVAVTTSWILSVSIFAVLALLLMLLMKKREAIFAKLNHAMEKKGGTYSSKTVVRKYRPIKLLLPYLISHTILFFKGVRVRYTYEVRKLSTPCIVLCTHGSFFDFVYSGSLLRRYAPNFIVARLYFFKKPFARLLRAFGCFPKGMFTPDVESAKNCLRVIRAGGVLAMMPEARLSTAGKFEDIQPSTFAFLKKAGLPVYLCRMDGSYLARPKWATSIRRGALVEAKLSELFSAEQIASLSVEEIEKKCIEAMRYNDFAWLESHPKIRYKNRTLAEGLDNVLTLCPLCESKYKLRAKGRTVTCEACGAKAVLDDRYTFSGDVPFSTPADWYAWEEGKMHEAIESEEGFSLTASVELCHASSDGKRALRHSGYGKCTLSADGLTYHGTEDTKIVEKHFPISAIYRLLFGAGEDFEVYEGGEIYYFVPEEIRSCVDFYTASKLLYDKATSETMNSEVTTV